MATTLPADTTKANFDAGSDDPKQARAEFATNADIQNTLKGALGTFAQLSNPAGSGLEVVSQGGGTPDDIRVFHAHERKTSTYLAVATDRSKLLEMDSASAIILDLTAAATLGGGWFILVHNSGAGTLTIDPNSSELIDDAVTITLELNKSVMIVCDGAAFWTVGALAAAAGITLGTEQATTSGTAFDFTVPAGTKRITILFKGVSLSGTDNIIVRIGDAGGIETSGYASSGMDAGSSISSTAGFILRPTSGAHVIHGSMILSLEEASNFTWMAQHGMAVAGGEALTGGGSKSLSAELTQVRITRTGSNTFDAGAVNISYE